MWQPAPQHSRKMDASSNLLNVASSTASSAATWCKSDVEPLINLWSRPFPLLRPCPTWDYLRHRPWQQLVPHQFLGDEDDEICHRSNQSEMSSILFFHIMRGNLFHHVSCTEGDVVKEMLQMMQSMGMASGYVDPSQKGAGAMWRAGDSGGHGINPPSWSKLWYSLSYSRSSDLWIVETSAASNNCFRKLALWCFMITIPYFGCWVTDLAEKTWSPGAVEAQQDAQLTQLSCRRWSE